MKTLVIHHHESYHRFKGLYTNFLFQIEDNGRFNLYSRHPSSGEECLCACFKDWDYFLVEEEIN